ncbi:Cytosolic endo-beta-N-acetylglucosaminidase [Quillaja saponaria]|uniref:mannosyl-glycoprotein endo-beta-N-acetylglucosaminidase n=1 Tax=Quillaja saponaria TaxID=32244 RepID=A0AAD7LT92_QUISA|nr:Cytosolic endo-beta-N-acetylglucosaminidase [Quillaja saponaria]
MDRQTLIFLRDIQRSIQRKIQTVYLFLTSSLWNLEPEPQAPSPQTPPFDPREPSLPISFPIKTLHELESRSYFESFHYPFNKAYYVAQSGSSAPSSLPNRRRLLVCHDMAGGYGDDKWVQGGNNPDAYTIWHWHLIDVFVYFSHSLVTLPPPCWTNTAHRHGVKVLGTFITEWDEGKVICDKLLSRKESAQMYAHRLVELAVALGFDGWLINIEVNLDRGQISNLKEFVNHLSITMHSSLPGSLVLWYDSVTIDGKLSWQDRLNNKNKLFFDICDGIFVNYTWKEHYPSLSAAVAGDRKFDVYMGIDVFGRNTYGGGQWNVNLAFDVIKREDVSAAIFVPGWVYETKQPPDFQIAQNCWWSLVDKSWGILQNHPKVLPFYTNFDQGRGYHFSVDGGEVSDAPWCNISFQGLQPLLDVADGSIPDSIEVLVDVKEPSYGGGGNITFKGTLKDNNYFRTRLFQGEFLLGDLPVLLIYSVKSEGNSLLGLVLELSSSTTNEKASLLLAPGGANQLSSKFTQVIMTSQFKKQGTVPGWVVHESSISMNGYRLREIHAVSYKSNPELDEIRSESGLDCHDSMSSSSPANYFAILGHITIKTPKHNSDFPQSTSWLVNGEHIKWTWSAQGSKNLSIKLTWKLKDVTHFVFHNYNIYVQKLTEVISEPAGTLERARDYLGTAHVNCFYVSNHEVPSDISSLKFFIQTCGADGTYQKLDDSPYFLLETEAKVESCRRQCSLPPSSRE